MQKLPREDQEGEFGSSMTFPHNRLFTAFCGFGFGFGVQCIYKGGLVAADS
jgi:hypothetical protein